MKFVEKCKIRAITPFKVIEVGTNRKPVCGFIFAVAEFSVNIRNVPVT